MDCFVLAIEKPIDCEGFTFIQGTIENMPFIDKYFDKVVCSNVLEHVVDYLGCIKEMVRAAKKEVIIILPRQREYRYLADLHVRFFPYEYSVRTSLPHEYRDAEIKLVGGDWGVRIKVKE